CASPPSRRLDDFVHRTIRAAQPSNLHGIFTSRSLYFERGVNVPMSTRYKRYKRVWFGRPLASDRLEQEKLNKKTALAVLSSDAISSVAYATDQHLLVIPFSVLV